jgi:hypothetical protein
MYAGFLMPELGLVLIAGLLTLELTLALLEILVPESARLALVRVADSVWISMCLLPAPRGH